MRLVRRYFDLANAENDAEFLEGRGIPTHLSSKASFSLGGAHTGAIRVGLWVILNSQFADAVKVLEDPNYPVSSPLSKAQIIELKEQAAVSALDSLFNTVMHWFILSLLVVVLGVVGWNILR